MVQNVVVAKPYRFVAPFGGTRWPRLMRWVLPWYLRRAAGVLGVQTRGLDRLRASADAGCGIMVAPNHCRPCDPFVVTAALYEAGLYPHIMASSHLFMTSRLLAFLLPRVGVFSIYREGLDREALKCAVRILNEARRPLIVFPEGVISRHNDRLNHLMEGTALMARGAARQRASAQPAGRVVIHPVAIRYVFEGDADAAAAPMIAEIERRLSWAPRDGMPTVERVIRAGVALLALKEIEFFGGPQNGETGDRVQRLIDRLLCPLEEEWLKGRREADVVTRVKLLRIAILPDLISGAIPEQEGDRRWRQLADIALAQQLAFYPAGYFTPAPTPERILETVERFEEDLTDKVRVLAPFRALVEIGEAVEVAPDRPRSGEGDPLMTVLRERLESMLAASLAEVRGTREQGEHPAPHTMAE